MKPRAQILVPVAVSAAGLAGALILVATRPEFDVAPKERQEQFRDFAFRHSAQMLTASNPSFFEGTALASDVASLRADAP